MNYRYWIGKLIHRNHVEFAKWMGVKVGKGCRFSGAPGFSEYYLVEIGDHVMLAAGVLFVTHDSANWVFREQEQYNKTMKFGKIKVCNNVYIGSRAIIMPGVTIGEGSVVGAGSVVTHDVAPGTIVAGVPAKVINTVDNYAKRLLSEMPEYDEELLKQDRQKGVLEFLKRYNEKNNKI